MARFVSKRIMLIAAALFVAVAAWAQSDLGTITGYVKDPSGATVPGAKVTVSNQTGLQRQATSNESGRYVVTNVPPGIYSITVEAPGFKKYESSDNKLNPSGVLTLDASLTLGAASETVQVSATATALQTESASVQQIKKC